jgi:hypothetical protein
VIQAVAAPDRELDKHLSDWQELEFIRERGPLPKLEYMFKHVVYLKVFLTERLSCCVVTHRSWGFMETE